MVLVAVLWEHQLSHERCDICHCVSAAASQLGELNPRNKRRKDSKAALLAKAEAKQQGGGAGDAAAEVIDSSPAANTRLPLCHMPCNLVM